MLRPPLLAAALLALAAAAPAAGQAPAAPAAEGKAEPKPEVKADAPRPAKDAPREKGRGAPPVVAVLPLRALGVPPEAAAALEATLRNEVAQLPEVTPAQADVLAAALQREADCVARVACGAAAAAKAGAQRFVAGTVSELGDAYMVDLKLVDARSGQELRRVTHPVSGRQELLIELLRATAVELLAPARFVGRLSVKLLESPTAGPDAVAGAQLFVDGKLAGVLPLAAPIDGVSPGQHTLRVSKEGFHDATLFVEVRFDRTTEAYVDLERGALAGVAFLRPQEKSPAQPPSALPGPPLLLAGEAPRPRSPWGKIAGWSGVGLGALAVVIGVALHTKAYATASELNRKEAATTLQPSDVGLYDDIDREVTAARALYVLGAVVGAGGGALLLWERAQEQPGQLAPVEPVTSRSAGPRVSLAPDAILRPGGAGLGLRGRF